MRRPSWLIAACAALIAAALAWWLTADPTPDAGASAGGDAGLPSRPRSPMGSALTAAPLREGTGAQVIRGSVVDDRVPVAGATVVAVRADSEEKLGDLTCGGACDQQVVHCGTGEADAKIADWATQRRGEGPPVARAVTAADGTFTLTGLEAGGHRVWASAPGHGVALVEQAEAGAVDVEVSFDDSVGVFGKLLTPNGDPVPGAWLTGFHPDFPRYFDVQSQADGTFDFGKVPMAHFSIVATLGAATVHEHVRISGRTRALELTLGPPAQLRVLVTEGGRPAPGAQVEVRDNEHVRATVTPASGEVTVTVPPLRPVLLTAARGQAGAEKRFGPLGIPPSVTLELAASRWVEGTVRDEGEVPLAGARISSVGAVSTTAGDGTYRLGPLALRYRPGIDEVRATAKDFVDEAKDLACPDAGACRIDFVLKRGVTVSGRVLSAAGAPLEGAEVRADGARSAMPVTTGPDGTFVVTGISPGPIEVSARHPTRGLATRDVAAPAAAVELQMPAGATLDVQVVDPRDRPLRLQVGVITDASLLARGRDGPDESREGRTDREGRIAFEGLPAGDYVIAVGEIMRDLRATQTVTLAKDARRLVKLVVPDGLKIEGTVADDTGKLLADVAVRGEPTASSAEPGVARTSRALLQQLGRSSTTTDARGRFILEHLAAGPYKVSAHRHYESRDVSAEAGAVGVAITLPAERFAVGRVVDAAGAPVRRFTANNKQFDSESGAFRVAVSARGATHLMVEADGFPVRLVPLPETKDTVTDVGTVRLAPGLTVRVRVTTEAGAPIANALVRADHARREAETEDDGVALLTGVTAEGPVAIQVRAEGYLENEVPLGAGATEVHVVLGKGGAVEGAVFAADGGPALFANVSLRATEAGRPGGGQAVTEEGNYRIPAAAPGAWVAQADLGPGHLKIPSQEVRVVAGQTARVDFFEPKGAVSVVVDFVNAAGEPVMVMGALTPGIAAAPDTMAAYRAVLAQAVRVPPGREAAVTPGEYTVIGLVVTGSTTSQLFSFTDRIVVGGAGRQTFTVRLPSKLTEVKRP